MTIDLGKFCFATGKSDLPADAKATFDTFAKSYPTKKIDISAYHDAHGSIAQNQELAKPRAFGVRDQLRLVGLNEQRTVLMKPVQTQGGAGQDNPDARRVEVSLKWRSASWIKLGPRGARPFASRRGRRSCTLRPAGRRVSVMMLGIVLRRWRSAKRSLADDQLRPQAEVESSELGAGKQTFAVAPGRAARSRNPGQLRCRIRSLRLPRLTLIAAKQIPNRQT